MALLRPDDQTKALGGYVSEIFAMQGLRRRLAAEMPGPDVLYDLGAGHPPVGRRIPSLDLRHSADPPQPS